MKKQEAPSSAAQTNSSSFEPSYCCWFERDFWADRHVVKMTWLQRHFYRALLQAAFFCSSRPYLPDDEELWTYADAESLEMWQREKGPVLAKFQKFTDESGRSMLRHKRLDSDWQLQLEAHERKQKRWEEGSPRRTEAARKAANTRWSKDSAARIDDATACDPMRRDALTETEIKLKQKLKNETETETETESHRSSVQVGSGHTSVSGSGSVVSSGASSKPTSGSVEPHFRAVGLAEIFDKYSLAEVDAVVFNPICENPSMLLRNVANWALTTSNYWEKTKRDPTPENFVRYFATLKSQYQSYADIIDAKRAEKRAAAGLPPREFDEDSD